MGHWAQTQTLPTVTFGVSPDNNLEDLDRVTENLFLNE